MKTFDDFLYCMHKNFKTEKFRRFHKKMIIEFCNFPPKLPLHINVCKASNIIFQDGKGVLMALYEYFKTESKKQGRQPFIAR